MLLTRGGEQEAILLNKAGITFEMDKSPAGK